MNGKRAKMFRAMSKGTGHSTRILKRAARAMLDQPSPSRTKGVFMGRQNPFYSANFGEYLTGVYARRAVRKAELRRVARIAELEAAGVVA